MLECVGVTPHDFKVSPKKEKSKMLDMEYQGPEEPATAAVLAKKLNVVDHDSGFAVRHCPGMRPFLNWQAGVMISEKRNMRVGKRWEMQNVSLFFLKGYGNTRDEAIENAIKAGRKQ